MLFLLPRAHRAVFFNFLLFSRSISSPEFINAHRVVCLARAEPPEMKAQAWAGAHHTPRPKTSLVAARYILITLHGIAAPQNGPLPLPSLGVARAHTLLDYAALRLVGKANRAVALGLDALLQARLMEVVACTRQGQAADQGEPAGRRGKW